MWEHFSAYHIDRLEACAAGFSGSRRIVGVEVASHSHMYAWKPLPGANGWERHTLFPGAVAEDVPWQRKLVRSLATVRACGARDVFLCNHDHPEILALLPLLRLQGTRVYVMLDAKFDDSPRRIAKEAVKPAVLRRFNGGLLAGKRSLEYLHFLGARPGWARMGYDTVSVERVRQSAGESLAPDGISHAERDFVAVARFVPKKELGTAIRAFARFCHLCPDSTRRLVLCGSGPLEDELRGLAAALNVGHRVLFPGFLGPEETAHTLARSLALVLPSQGEQWGLVVNEAVALGIPVLCSDNAGARDTLVRTGVNGFIFEPGNDEGLAQLMRLLGDNEGMWRKMSLACHRFAPLADTREFVRSVGELIGIDPALVPAADAIAANQGVSGVGLGCA